nr:hypothetical protein [Tanacetum cinerariifolium]
MKSGIKSVNDARQKISKAAVTVNTARPVTTAHPKRTMNAAKPRSCFSNSARSIIKRPINNRTTSKNSKINQKVNIVRATHVNTARPKVNTARPKAVLNVVQGNQVKIAFENADSSSRVELIPSKIKTSGNYGPRGQVVEAKLHSYHQVSIEIRGPPYLRGPSPGDFDYALFIVRWWLHEVLVCLTMYAYMVVLFGLTFLTSGNLVGGYQSLRRVVLGSISSQQVVPEPRSSTFGAMAECKRVGSKIKSRSIRRPFRGCDQNSLEAMIIKLADVKVIIGESEDAEGCCGEYLKS